MYGSIDEKILFSLYLTTQHKKHNTQANERGPCVENYPSGGEGRLVIGFGVVTTVVTDEFSFLGEVEVVVVVIVVASDSADEEEGEEEGEVGVES
jgi:hypothetical protein